MPFQTSETIIIQNTILYYCYFTIKLSVSQPLLSFEMSELNNVVCDYLLIKNDCTDTVIIEDQKAELDNRLKSLFINNKNIK